MKKFYFISFLFIFISFTSYSQTSSISILATVLSPISITTTDLNFGSVVRNVSKTITPGGSGSGKFEVTGEAGKEVQFSFIVPTYISSGSNELSYSCSNSEAKYSTDASGTPGTTFSPLSTITTNLSSSGKLYVFIGGKLQPTSSQAAGSYSGTITMSIQYTGN